MLVPVAETFYRLAQAFELLAIALDDSDNLEDRKDLLTRMKALIDEIDELLHREAVDSKGEPPERIRAVHDLEKFLKSASKTQATIVP